MSDAALPARGTHAVRVVLPAHLRKLARQEREVVLDVAAPLTVGAVLDALEAAHPVLRGTIRDQRTRKRRPFVRFFACEQDLSHDPPTLRCRTRSRAATSPSSSSARWPAADPSPTITTENDP